NTRQPRPAASFAARSRRWTSSAARPEPRNSQNAQRNYERYLALARAEAQIGNTVGAENYYQICRTLFQIDALRLRRDERDLAVMAPPTVTALRVIQLEAYGLVRTGGKIVEERFFMGGPQS